MRTILALAVGPVMVAGMGLFCAAAAPPPRPGADKDDAVAATVKDDAVAATVGEEAIHWGDVRRMVAKATGGKPVAAAAMPFLQAQALEEIVSRRLVLAYARRQGEAATAAQLDAALADLKAKLRAQHRKMEDFLKSQSVTEDDLHRQLAWNVVWERYLARYVTPSRCEAYFQSHRRELDGSRVSVSQILLRPDAAAGRSSPEALLKQAEDLRRRILAGEISFADAAEKYSTGPSAKQGGRFGDLARHGAMDEAFSRAAFALKVGEVSPPVRTPLGVRLIRCDAVQPGSKQLADVRKEVEAALARELLEKLAGLERRSTAVKYRDGIPHELRIKAEGGREKAKPQARSPT